MPLPIVPAPSTATVCIESADISANDNGPGEAREGDGRGAGEMPRGTWCGGADTGVRWAGGRGCCRGGGGGGGGGLQHNSRACVVPYIRTEFVLQIRGVKPISNPRTVD